MSKFTITPTIFYGVGALEQAKLEIASYGKRCLIVTDPTIIKLDQLKGVKDILEKENKVYEVFSDIKGEPTVEMVMDGVRVFRLFQADYIIAIGGGAVLDAAKAISMALSLKEEEKLHDFIKKDFNHKEVKVIAIPTTAGTGSEVTRFSIITDTSEKIKMLLKGDAIIPDMAIVDPRYILTMPRNIAVATGIDALCHAIESYLSIHANTMSMQYSISAIRRIFKNLNRSIDEENIDINAKEEMSLAAMEAGIAFNNSSVTLIHGMSRPIGAMFHVPHGNSNAMLILNCMKTIKEPMNKKFAEIARKCGFSDSVDDQVASQKFMDDLENFILNLNIKTLQDYGVTKEMLDQNVDKMSKDALESGSPANLNIDFTINDIKKIYYSLYE